MTNAQIIETFVVKLTARIQHRMDAFGDSYEKAKSVVQLESIAGPKVWAILDAKFA